MARMSVLIALRMSLQASTLRNRALAIACWWRATSHALAIAEQG